MADWIRIRRIINATAFADGSERPILRVTRVNEDHVRWIEDDVAHAQPFCRLMMAPTGELWAMPPDEDTP